MVWMFVIVWSIVCRCTPLLLFFHLFTFFYFFLLATAVHCPLVLSALFSTLGYHHHHHHHHHCHRHPTTVCRLYKLLSIHSRCVKVPLLHGRKKRKEKECSSCIDLQPPKGRGAREIEGTRCCCCCESLDWIHSHSPFLCAEKGCVGVYVRVCAQHAFTHTSFSLLLSLPPNCVHFELGLAAAGSHFCHCCCCCPTVCSLFALLLLRLAVYKHRRCRYLHYGFISSCFHWSR